MVNTYFILAIIPSISSELREYWLDIDMVGLSGPQQFRDELVRKIHQKEWPGVSPSSITIQFQSVSLIHTHTKWYWH